MRRILFVVSLLVVLNQIKSAEAVNVDTWTGFVVNSVGFNVDLTDNITQPDGDKKFSRTFNHNLNGNGYTISGGNGGKIFFKFNKASGKIENVTFKDFKSLENSGGFFISSGSEIALDKVTFNNISNPLDGGHETSWGGALNVDANSQNIKISNSNFIDNIQHTTTDDNGGSLGGALHIQGKMSNNDYSRLEYLKDSKFDGNQMNAHNSNAYGGAIFLEGQIGTFSGNELDKNQATASADGKNAYGGALAVGGANENRGTAQISAFEDNTFNNNLAESGKGGTAQGGAVYVANSGKTSFKNSTFKNNKAAAEDGTAKGGAISNSYAEDDTVSMSGLTMDSNVAEGAVAQGGAIYNDGVISDMSGDDDHEFVISNNKATGTVANVLGAYVGEGGGVYNSGTIKQISKVSFSSNEASESGGAIFNDRNAKINSISNSTFSGNTAVKGGAIYNSGTISNLTDSKFETATDTIENVAGATIETVKNVTAAASVNNAGTINEIDNSSFSVVSGTALNNTGTIGKIKNSTFSYGSGTGIATTEDLNLVADNGNLTFSGAGTALEMGAGNMVNVKTANGGKASFDGTIKANGGKLALSGDNSNGSRIAFNGTVDNADISLANANLSLGNANVLTNSSLNAQSGKISLALNNYDTYKIKNLTATENVKWNFNISLSKENGNKYNVLDIEDGSGTVYLDSLNVQDYANSMLDDETYTIQLIKSASGNAPLLNYDGAIVLTEAQAEMSNKNILAKEFGLATTDTTNDSIRFRGLMNSIAGWAELNTTLDKKFTFYEDASISRDIDKLRGTNLTLEGNGNVFDVNNKNMLAEIGTGQNVTINNLTLNNVGETANNGTLNLNGVNHTGFVANKAQLNMAGDTQIAVKLSNTGSVANSDNLTVNGGLQNDGAITTADGGSLSVAGGNSVNSGTISGGVKFSDTTLDNSGKIDNIYDSSFKTADGTALNNTDTIGEIKNSTFDYGFGTGIATTEDLNLVADNGNLTFSGAGTALEMGAGNMVNVKTANGGKASFDGTIKANGGKLALSGDNSNGSRIALNGTVDNADVSLVDANLSLGNTDVLANSYLKAESGTISFVQDNYGSYKIKKLESSENVKWNFNISLSKDDGNKYDALEIKDGSGTVYISSLDVSAAQDYTDSMDFEESHTIQLIKSSSDNAPELTYDQAKVLQQAQAVMSTDYFIAKEFGLATTKTKNDSIQFRGLMDSIAAWAELDTTLDKKFTFNADYSISRDITALRGKNLTLEGNGNKFDVKNKNMLAKIGAGQNVTINNLTLNNVGTTENNGTLSLNEVAYNGDVTNNSHMNTDGNTQINGKFNNNGTVQNDGQLTLAADSENNGTIAGAGSVIAGNGTEAMNFANNGYISGKTYVSDKAVLESDLDKLNDVDIAVGGLFKVGADGELNQNISGEGEMLVSNLLNMGSGSLSQNGILTVADSGTINIGEKQVRVGTFNLNGTLALDISQITANSASYTGGQIIVGDGANIAGDAKLRITVTADSLNKGSKTGELQLISGNNVSGLFNNIISNNRYDIVKGEQDGTVIIINTASAEDVANKVGNRNNRNTARAWDRVNVSAGSKAEQIYNILNDLSQHDAKEYVSALTKVAPADSQLAMMTTREVNNQINRSIWHRFGRNRALCNTPFASASAWIEGMGGYAHQNSSFEAAGFNAHTAGYMLGIDGTVDCATTAGFGYAFNNTKATSQGRDTGIKGHTAFAYAKYQPKQAYVRGTISYGYADYDERSAVQDVDIKTKYHVQALSAETAAGYEFTDGFIPEAGLRYTYLMPQKYTDNFGQHVQAENTDLLTGFVGMRYRPRCGAIWYNVRPTAYVGMSYDIYNRDTKANVSIADQQYEISGQKLPRWGLETGVGVEVSINHWDLSVGYDFGLREKYQAHTGMLNARYNF